MFIYWIKRNNNPAAGGKFIPYGGGFSGNVLINTEETYGCRKDKTGGLCAHLLCWTVGKLKVIIHGNIESQMRIINFFELPKGNIYKDLRKT